MRKSRGFPVGVEGANGVGDDEVEGVDAGSLRFGVTVVRVVLPAQARLGLEVPR